MRGARPRHASRAYLIGRRSGRGCCTLGGRGMGYGTRPHDWKTDELESMETLSAATRWMLFSFDSCLVTRLLPSSSIGPLLAISSSRSVIRERESPVHANSQNPTNVSAPTSSNTQQRPPGSRSTGVGRQLGGISCCTRSSIS
jgi:hypothetical protein